jgi:hypothetical protein
LKTHENPARSRAFFSGNRLNVTLADPLRAHPLESQDVSSQPGESVAVALAGVRQTTRFTDPAALDAYYAVEAALAAGDTLQPEAREALRRAAERLSAQDSDAKLASQLRTVADALTPETGSLLAAARALWARIEASTSASKRPRWNRYFLQGQATPTLELTACPTWTDHKAGMEEHHWTTTALGDGP